MKGACILAVFGLCFIVSSWAAALRVRPVVFVLPASFTHHKAAAQRYATAQALKRAYWKPQGRFGKRAPAENDGSDVTSDAEVMTQQDLYKIGLLGKGWFLT